MEKESMELDILLKEHKRLNGDIQRLLGQIVKVGAFWLVIMSSIYAIALKEEHLKVLFLIIPSLFLIVWADCRY
jgi:hypothetical protein